MHASASPVSARAIRLEGGHNVRDMGGLPLPGGGRTRRGVVYRGPALDALTETGRDEFAGLGIVRAIDLREEEEFEILDTGWMGQAGVELVHAPSSVPRPARADIELFANPGDATPDQVIAWKELSYRKSPERLAGAVKTLFESIADEGKTPVLFHCAGGADRTGVLGAVLLLALGADRADVMEDYLYTNVEKEYVKERRSARDVQETLSAYGLAGLSPDAAAALSTLRAEFLEAALLSLEQQYGDVATYILEHCDVPFETLEVVRTRMSDPET